MEVRTRRLAAIAIALVIFGLVLPALYAHWLETGSTVVLDMPFSATVVVFGALGLLAFFTRLRIEKRGLIQVGIPNSNSPRHAFFPLRCGSPRRIRFSQPPSFGLVYSLVLGTVLMPSFLIFYYIWGYDQHSKGIEVHLVSLGPLRTPPDVGLTPVVVRIEYRGDHPQPGLHLNSKPIPLDGLSASLKTQLKTRSEWVVYVEADSNVDWADAMNAIDIIRESGAKIVLLTTEVTAPSRSTNHARRR